MKGLFVFLAILGVGCWAMSVEDLDSDSGSSDSGSNESGAKRTKGMLGGMMGKMTVSKPVVNSVKVDNDALTIINNAEKKGQMLLVKVDLIIALMSVIEGKLNALKSGNLDIGMAKHPKMAEIEVFLKTHLGGKSQSCATLRETQSKIVMKELYDDVYAKANPVITKNKAILFNMRDTLNVNLKKVQQNKESEVALCRSNLSRCQQKLENPEVVVDIEGKLKVMEDSVRTLIKDVKAGLKATAPQKIENQIIKPVSECMKKHS